MSIYSSLCDDIVDFGTHNSNPRKDPVSIITPHHFAFVGSAVNCAKVHYKGNAASANYYIGNDGKICGGVSEDRRAWTSGTGNAKGTNDHKAITIEVSNSGGKNEGWPISDAAYKSLVKLCADICKRYNIIPHFDGTKDGTITEHCMFQATECPGRTLKQIIASEKLERDILEAMAITPPTPTPQPADNERRIWDFLLSKIGNEYGVAGMMGNLRGESRLQPNNLQDSFEPRLGMNDEQYTAAVDSGTYSKDQFVHDGAGYGLAQWTFWQRKENLYNFKGAKSISDLDMQLDFIWSELTKGYTTTLKALQTATSIYNATVAVLTQYEKPANQSEAVRIQRAKYGQEYYDKYATGGGGDVPQCPYIVRITATVLNVRTGPGTQYPIARTVVKGEAFTIVETSDNWGKLKSGAGWICLDYTEPVKR